MKKARIFLAALLVVAMVISSSVCAFAASGSVATNGDQKITITIKVKDDNGNAVSGSSVKLTAKDFNIFAKTPNLSLTAVTGNDGVATFKISSSYDRVTGYSVINDAYEPVSLNLYDTIGVILYPSKRSYTVTAKSSAFTVKFYDAAGNIIDTQAVAKGQAATAPQAPAYNGDCKYKMEFSKWDTDFSSVNEPLDVKPVYNMTGLTSTDRLLVLPLVNHPVIADAYLPASNDSISMIDCFGSADEYAETDGKIRMGDEDDSVVTFEGQISKYYDAKKAPYNVITPTSVSNGKAQNRMEIESREGTFYIVYTDQTTKMKYETSFSDIDWNRLVRKGAKSDSNKIYGTTEWTTYYPVNFHDAAGDVIDTRYAVYGGGVEAPEAPAYNGKLLYNMTFTGWDTTFNEVTGPIDVYPEYKKAEAKTIHLKCRVNHPVNENETTPVANNGIAFYDIFGAAASYSETYGVIEMGDGTSLRVEDQMGLSSFVPSGNVYNKSGYRIEKRDDDKYYIIFVIKGVDSYETCFNDIDWNSFSRTDSRLYGIATWTKITQTTESDASAPAQYKRSVERAI